MAPEVQHQNGKHANGKNIQNGINGDASSHQIPETQDGPKKGSSKGLISTMLKLRAASQRPLPTEMGDGSYRAVMKRPSIVQDLRRIGISGTNTLHLSALEHIQADLQTSKL